MILSEVEFLSERPLSRTTAEYVLELLTRDILTGRFKPGEQLVERELTERYGVSRTPLREALRSLVRSQLAVTVPYHGVYVREISFDFAREVYELRVGMDRVAGYHAATRATARQLRELREIYEAINERSQPVEGDLAQQARRDEILLLNNRFHRKITEASHNELLLAKLDELWASINLVRYGSWRTDARTESSKEEHGEILAALVDRQPDRAAALCADHAWLAWLFVSSALENEASAES